MRVTTELWVSALIRRVFSDGGFAAVVKRGATEAGAVFIISRNRLGEITLFGPASQTAYEEGRPDDRRFSELMLTTDPTEIDTRLAKEQRFDFDIWVVELETGQIGVGELIPLV
jgi:hypothetical protein